MEAVLKLTSFVFNIRGVSTDVEQTRQIAQEPGVVRVGGVCVCVGGGGGGV